TKARCLVVLCAWTFLDERRGVGRSALLFRVDAVGPSRHRRARAVTVEPHLSRCAVPLVDGDWKLQSGGVSDCVCNFFGSGVFRTPDHLIWLWISRRIADIAAAIPPERPCSALADPTYVLYVGEYARIVASGADHFHDDRCR